MGGCDPVRLPRDRVTERGIGAGRLLGGLYGVDRVDLLLDEREQRGHFADVRVGERAERLDEPGRHLGRRRRVRDRRLAGRAVEVTGERHDLSAFPVGDDPEFVLHTD